LASLEVRRAYLALVIGVFCFSFSSILIRMVDAPAPAIAAYRMILVSLLIAPIALAKSSQKILGVSRNDTWFLIATGAVLAIHFLLFVSAVQNTSVANATVLINSHPVIVAILAFVLLKEGNRFTAAGAALGMLGIMVISLADYGSGNLYGDVLAFLGAVMEAIYIIMTRFMRKKIDILTFLFFVNTATAITLVGICLIGNVPLWPYSNYDLAVFLAMAIVPAGIGYSLYNYSLRWLLAPQVSVIQLGEAVFASIMAIFLFSEVPSVSVLLGGLLILGGILLVVHVNGKKKRLAARGQLT
jgi:drug/metabolite transporter (DMT)-like permease